MSYKIITKTLTNRLKELMPFLTSQNQCSFVPGRQISDNIVIYQEVLHSMRSRTLGNGILLIKIDLEKAYDRVSWSFIKDTLQTVGLPNVWIRKVMHYVETVQMSVLWNGKQLEWFKPTRGTRQGDAMSPYLFVLCMERLGHLIDQAVQEGRWSPEVIAPWSPSLPFIFC